MVACFGAYMHMMFHIGGAVTTSGCAFTMLYLFITKNRIRYSTSRLFMLMLFAFFTGVSYGAVFQLVFDIEPLFLYTISTAAAIPFGCFYLVSALYDKRDINYFLAIVSSSVSFILLLCTAQIIFGESYLNKIICCSFIVFLFWICQRTDQVIDEANHGDLDYINHTSAFFSAAFREY